MLVSKVPPNSDDGQDGSRWILQQGKGEWEGVDLAFVVPSERYRQSGSTTSIAERSTSLVTVEKLRVSREKSRDP